MTTNRRSILQPETQRVPHTVRIPRRRVHRVGYLSEYLIDDGSVIFDRYAVPGARAVHLSLLAALRVCVVDETIDQKGRHLIRRLGSGLGLGLSLIHI